MKRRSQLLGSFANLRLKKVATRSARRSSRFRGLLRIHNVGRTRSQKLEEHLSYRSLVKSQSRSLKTSQDKKKSSDTQKDSSKPVFSNGQRKINLEQETLMEVPSLSPPVIQKCFKCRRLLKGEFVTCATKLNKQGLRCNNTAHVACISLESSSCLERDLKNWRCSECYSHCTFCKELLLIEDQGVVKCEGCWLYFHLNCVSAYIKLLDETSPYDSSKFSVKHDSWYCYLCTVFNGQIIESILTHKPSEPEILNKTRSSSAPICDPTLSENFSEFEKNENIDISLVLYVKFSQMSHFHDGWVPDYWVEACNVSLFRRYKRRIETINGPSVRSVVHQDWKTMQRVIAEKKEPAPFGPSKKVRKLYYVKWTNMEYAESTWEYLSSGGRAGSFYNAYLKDSEVDFAGVARLEEQLVVLYKAFLSHMAVQDTPACRTPKFKEINEQPAFLAGGQLHSYQLDGLNWLLYNMTHRINCILADEMGLGKTLQAVSYICCRYQLEDFGVGLSFRQNPCLVVAPLSTCHNWLAEFSKWAPQLNVVFYSGDAASREIIENHELFLPFSRGLPRIHVLVTTYENCLSNPPFLRRIKWMAIIVDEGQRLKNNESKLFYTLSQIDDAHRILLTGTPLQNDIYELHNLLLFLDPAKFDSDNYREKFSSENWTDIKNIEDLHRRIRPHLLRRVKSDVLSDLPPKKEVIVPTCKLRCRGT
ncbi:uncharacterized protein LOC135120586 [Zophobas morio]|uniref:uncharacterized protein LOC135120586 n=1 Tax=Zophobas morio TaxID=2755281 RepID=UPI0030838004